MKFALIVFVVALVLFNLRGGLARRKRSDVRPGAGGATPKPMLSCAQCGVHLPRDEALPGRGGVFCCAAHRTAFEQSHPAR